MSYGLISELSLQWLIIVDFVSQKGGEGGGRGELINDIRSRTNQSKTVDDTAVQILDIFFL